MRNRSRPTFLGVSVAILFAFIAPAKSTAQPSESRFRRGLLAAPYLGVNVPIGTGGSFDTGYRGGVLLGWHGSTVLSLNGEFTIDVLNPSSRYGPGSSESMEDVLFSPLLHFGGEGIEGFIGPKIGGFASSSTANFQSTSLHTSEQGVAYGFNFGAAIPAGAVAIGGLVSLVVRHPTHVCNTRPGQSEQCGASANEFGTLSAVGLVLF